VAERKKWKDIVRQAKAYSGLSASGRRRKRRGRRRRRRRIIRRRRRRRRRRRGERRRIRRRRRRTRRRRRKRRNNSLVHQLVINFDSSRMHGTNVKIVLLLVRFIIIQLMDHF